MIHLSHVVKFLTLILLFLGQPIAVQAQQPQPQQNRDGYFRDLLDTYIDHRVGPTPAGSNPSAQPSGRTELPSEIRRAGTMLARASEEMKQLLDALQSDVYRANGVRQLLGLAFDVNADAAVVARQLSSAYEVDSLRPALRKLDQEWRTLEYRLSQTRNLSSRTLGHIERINQFAEQLNALFQVQTQVDLNTLSQRASQMHQALRTLLEDIRFEISDRNLADRLFSAGRNTYEQLQRFIQLTRPYTNSRVSYEALRQEYERLDRHWNTYQATLRQANNRHLQRQIQRINDDMRAINAGLYIDSGQVNRSDLVHTTGILRGDIDRLLRRINLKMLTQIPISRRYAIEAASDLDQTCNDFAGLLNDEIENIRDMYLYMYDEWQRLNVALQGVGNQEARQAVRDVERSLGDLKAMLGVQFELDRAMAIEHVTTLNGLARHLQGDVRDIFSRSNGYSRGFQNDCLNEVGRFEAATRNLYAGLSRGGKLQELSEQARNMGVSWNSLSQLLPQFNSSDRGQIDQLRADITPQVVRMQTMLTP